MQTHKMQINEMRINEKHTNEMRINEKHTNEMRINEKHTNEMRINEKHTNEMYTQENLFFEKKGVTRLAFIKGKIKAIVARILHSLGLSEDVLYVGSSEALPPPLTVDEENELLQCLEMGDHRVKGTLIERNLRLVVYIARKFENTGVGIEDLVSIGTIGLIKAVNTFDPVKKIKLATYASRCIENEILMHLRRSNKIRSEVSFDEPLNVDLDGNELLLSDVMGTESDIIYKALEEEVDKKLLMQAMNKLSSRERNIVNLRFGLKGGKEKTQKEVADLLGISQSYISRLEKRIIKRLRKEIQRME